ncbi:MAG: STAS domain-containing protein [Thermoleophilia bacterium]|nr:STAS domain-containing protein [Thermoleophilia bacterium]
MAGSSGVDTCGPGLLVELEVGPERTRLSPVGELDLSTARIFVAALEAALRGRPGGVVLDLRRLAFIDAWSIGAIVSARTRAAQWGGTLTLSHPRGEVWRMLEICSLGHLCGPYESSGPRDLGSPGGRTAALRLGERSIGRHMEAGDADDAVA